MMFDTPKVVLEEEKPGYKVKQYGMEYLSYRELLSVLVGGSHALDVADIIVARWSSPIKLLQADIYDLASIKGVGESTATKIRAALQIGITLSKERYVADNEYTVHSPQDIAEFYKLEMSTHNQEVLKVILLNTRNIIIKDINLYKGTKNMSNINIGETYREAIKANAAAIIVMHNHPSGNPCPSSDDISITKHLCEAGKTLDIELLDHIIIGGGNYVSIKAEYSSAFIGQ